jgi:hypothetical protein
MQKERQNGIKKKMSPNPPSCVIWSDTPICINWSDASEVKEHEYTIIEMAIVWRLHEKDILGWQQLRDDAESYGNIGAMREFAARATYSRWVRKVLMVRLKFRVCGHDPYPNTDICSFSMGNSCGVE